MNANLNEGILEQATAWYARLRAPDCGATERRAFDSWLQVDAAHARAFQAVSATAEQVTHQAQIDPRLRALADAALAKPASPLGSTPVVSLPVRLTNCIERQWRRAAVVVFTVSVAALLATQMRTSVPQAQSLTRYSNHEKHEQYIQLEDGSIVHLDVGSQFNVSMTPQARRIELNQGRAYFEVAHDANRPFSVVAAGTRTVALGTRFEVAIKPDMVAVTLTEGSVAVSDSSDADHWREVLHPGQQLQVHDNQQRELHEINAQAQVSWSKSRLVFDNVPLAQALEEINRYASVKVSLGDSTLANVPIGGSFVAGGDSNEFVAALTAVLPLRSVSAGANEIVLFEKNESAAP